MSFLKDNLYFSPFVSPHIPPPKIMSKQGCLIGKGRAQDYSLTYWLPGEHLVWRAWKGRTRLPSLWSKMTTGWQLLMFQPTTLYISHTWTFCLELCSKYQLHISGDIFFGVELHTWRLFQALNPMLSFFKNSSVFTQLIISSNKIHTCLVTSPPVWPADWLEIPHWSLHLPCSVSCPPSS